MTEILLELEKVHEYLNFLQKCMTKQGNRHAIAYINGLLFSFKRSIRKISQNHLEYNHHSQIQRVLNTLKLDIELLQRKYLSKIRYFLKGEISLIFDDTLVERNGKCVEYTQTHHDHSSNSYITGHQFFTAMLCAENICFPLFPELFHKELNSKMDLAERLIKNIGKKISLTNVMFDSWYSKKAIIKTARKYATRVICGLKSNRTFSSEPKKWKKISAFADESKQTFMFVDERKYYVQSLIGRVKSVKGKCLISRQQNEQNISNQFYIFCSDRKLTEVQILRLYHIRWNIEVYHRDVKQNMGFHPFVRKKEAIVRHAIFTTLAYTALKMHMHFHRLDLTIGECITHIRESNFTNFIQEIVKIEDSKERQNAFEGVFIKKIAQV